MDIKSVANLLAADTEQLQSTAELLASKGEDISDNEQCLLTLVTNELYFRTLNPAVAA